MHSEVSEQSTSKQETKGLREMLLQNEKLSQSAVFNVNNLVKSRLIIRKQMKRSLGLQPITKCSNFDESYYEIRLSNQDLVENTKHLEERSQTSDMVTKFDSVLADQQNTSGLLKERKNLFNSSDKIISFSSPESSILIIKKNLKVKLKEPETPSPCAYHVPRKLPNQKSSPMFTMGFRRANPTQKNSSAKARKEKRPAPGTYEITSYIGNKNHPIYHKAPACLFAPKIEAFSVPLLLQTPSMVEKEKKDKDVHKPAVIEEEKEKSELNDHKYESKEDEDKLEIEDYELIEKKAKAEQKQILQHIPKSRRTKLASLKKPIEIKTTSNGRDIWPHVEETPGPGAYNPKFQQVLKSKPQYSVPLAKYRPNINYLNGPFSVF